VGGRMRVCGCGGKTDRLFYVNQNLLFMNLLKSLLLV